MSAIAELLLTNLTVRHFIHETAENCRNAVFAFATETVGDMPLLCNGQHYMPSITEASSSPA
jgi:hypothetical protein